MGVRVPPALPILGVTMKVELRVYPSLENSDNYSMGIYNSLPEAWNEAYRLTTITRYEMKDFFTLELEHETHNRV